MKWRIAFHPAFEPEYDDLDEPAQNELLAHLTVLEAFGPKLGRPHADTLTGSRYANMKELRFTAMDGVWRFAFAFDPARQGIMLCGGDKSGGSDKTFYRELIRKADERFAAHLARRTKKRNRP